MLDIELDRLFRLLDTDSVDGYWLKSGVMLSGPSSPGRQVSTIASRQFTTSSALSGVSALVDCLDDNNGNVNSATVGGFSLLPRYKVGEQPVPSKAQIAVAIDLTAPKSKK